MNHLTDGFVFTDSTQYTRAMTFNQSNAGAGALKFARELTGRPYVYGGTWPQSGGTDCSGLWEWAYAQVGIHLVRTTYGQYLEYPIPHNEPSQPGDLLFIAGSDAIGVEPGHVMGFVSPGEVFQAPYTGAKIGQYPYNTNVFEYRIRPALALPMPSNPPTKNPNAAQLAHAGLVCLTGPAQAHLALNNGWNLYVWGGLGFVGTPSPAKKGTPQYANVNFRSKRP